MLQWKLQSWVSRILPNETTSSYTVRVFGALLVLCLVVAALAWAFKRRWLVRSALGAGLGLGVVWGVLVANRPAWLRLATQAEVPMPAMTPLEWSVRAPGLETAEAELKVGGIVVDRMVLARLEPRRFRFTVHWDATASRTAEDWQRELGAMVVVSGTYFGGEAHAPLTPIRMAGNPAGPENYTSNHGAFVARDGEVEILDLKNKSVSEAIGAFPEALVSYPLLIDGQGGNRAYESKGWLASRNFVGLDRQGRVVLGTTETGFFTLRRLGDFLSKAPLDLVHALNFDGGPLVSQVIRAGGFTRSFHGTAEMTDGNDVLRAFWHSHLEKPWTLPIVLAVHPVP